ncbi:MAG: phage tail fiber protein [Phaeospirillum sp.]|nr:phage tail fiber protein [Phaeospirillum sp.]
MSETDISYCGDGRTTAFPVTYAIFDETDIQVWVDDSHLTSGFRVVVDRSMVIFAKAPASGTIVLLRRVLEVAKAPNFPAGAPVSARALDQEFHRLTAAIGQVADDLGRAVTRSPLSSSTADLTLPEPVPRRSLMWNADGSGLTNSGADLEALGRQVAAQVDEARNWASQSAASAATASRAEDTARTAAADIRTTADDAARTIVDAADISMVEARKAASLVDGIADPVAAYRKQKLLGLW